MKKIPIKNYLRQKIFMIAMIMMLCAGAAELSMAQWSSLFAERALGVSKVMGDLLGPLFAVFMGLGRTFYGLWGSGSTSRVRCSYVRFMRGVLPACFAGQQPGVCADGMLTLRPCSQSALAGHAQLFLGMLPGRRYGDVRDTCDLRGYWMFHWAVDHGFCIGRGAKFARARCAGSGGRIYRSRSASGSGFLSAILFPLSSLAGS